MSPSCVTMAEAILAEPEIQEVLTRKGYSGRSLVYDLGIAIFRLDRTLTGECLHRLAVEVASYRRKALLAAAAKAKAAPPPPMIAPVVVYRHFDADDRLLYIGISKEPERRMREHRLCSPWGSLIARVEIVEYRSRREAARAERSAIRSESPIHNVERYGAAAPAGQGAQP